jgi:hypothetical protein
MVRNQNYREDGEESPSAMCSRGLLWCERCVAGHYRARAVLTVTAVWVCCGEQPL